MEPEDEVEHLWKGAKSLSSEKHVTRLLKSHYINICRTVLADEIPNVSRVMCPYCSSYWSENEFKLKLRSQSKLAQNSKSRNLIAKLEKQEKTKETLLTSKQKRRAKWLRKCANTKLEIRCQFCGHKTMQALEKSKKESPKESQNIVEEPEVEVQPLKANKKKKRKDKTAGLKLAAFKSSKKTEEFLPPNKIVQIKQPSPKPEPKQPREVIKPKPQVNKPKVSIQQTSLKAKQTNKKTTAVSKTQYANKLVQLAELLKNQKKNPNAAANRLQALMK